jgi:hypothetical protein
MAKCWEQRGCDEEMQGECPHSVDFHDNCPTKCAFAACDRATYELTTDPGLIFDPNVDRDAAIKDGCKFCGFFLTKGPRLGE